MATKLMGGRTQPEFPTDREGGEPREYSSILGGLLVLGTAMRASVLSRIPFEQDELYTIIEARSLYDSPLHPGIDARPLFYLLQHPLLDVLPQSHAALRILPFIFGVMGIWVTWMLARRIAGPLAAIVATAIVTVSPWHLYASGMARYWSLVYLLSALFLLFLFRAQKGDRYTDYAGAVVALLLGIATHPTFVFPMIGIAVGVCLVGNDGRLRLPWPDREMLLKLWLPAFAGMAAWALLLMTRDGPSVVSNWDGRGWAASVRLLPAIIEWLTPVVFVAGALGALVLCRSEDAARRRWGFAAVLGVSGGLLALMAASLSTDVYADYAIAMLPLVFVSAGGLVGSAADRMRRGGFASAGMAALLFTAAVAPATASYLSDGMRFDYRPAFRVIAAEAPDLPVLTSPIIVQRHYAPELRGIELQFDYDRLESLLMPGAPAWAIVPVRRYGIWQDTNGELARWLVDRCRLHSSSERSRFDFRLYRTDLYRCEGTTG